MAAKRPTWQSLGTCSPWEHPKIAAERCIDAEEGFCKTSTRIAQKIRFPPQFRSFLARSWRDSSGCCHTFGELLLSHIKFVRTNPGSIEATPYCSIALPPGIAVVPPGNPAKSQNLDDRTAQYAGSAIPSQKRHSRPHPLLLRRFEGSSWTARNRTVTTPSTWDGPKRVRASPPSAIFPSSREYCCVRCHSPIRIAWSPWEMCWKARTARPALIPA